MAEYMVCLAPDNASVEASVTATGDEYQLSLIVPARVALLTGGVLSIFIPPAESIFRLPALSCAATEVEMFTPSRVKATEAGHVFIPDRASAQAKASVTVLEFQPNSLGQGALEYAIDGGVVSMLTLTVRVDDRPALSKQAPDTNCAAPSPDTVALEVQ